MPQTFDSYYNCHFLQLLGKNNYLWQLQGNRCNEFLSSLWLSISFGGCFNHFLMKFMHQHLRSTWSMQLYYMQCSHPTVFLLHDKHSWQTANLINNQEIWTNLAYLICRDTTGWHLLFPLLASWRFLNLQFKLKGQAYFDIQIVQTGCHYTTAANVLAVQRHKISMLMQPFFI